MVWGKFDQPVFRWSFSIPLFDMSNTTSFGYPIPTVRKVSALRQRMTDDMTVRNFAPNTQVSYLHQVNLFARHFDKSPERLGPEEILTYQIYLAKERKVSVSSRIVAGHRRMRVIN